MSENFFRRYSIPIGGPGLTAEAYALPKDLGVLRAEIRPPIDPLPPPSSPSVDTSLVSRVGTAPPASAGRSRHMPEGT